MKSQCHPIKNTIFILKFSEELMELHQLLGYILAVLVGISLGLMGSGGSILTVPILVYVMTVSPILATAYSLFVVGTTAFIGSIKNAYEKKIDFRKVMIFGIPSIIAVLITRRYLLPIVPQTLFEINGFIVTKPVFIMVLFAIVMIMASVTMLKSPKGTSQFGENTPIKYNYPLIFVLGISIGLLAGFVGSGGGFLIIPALVILAKTPIKKAMATSLCIIAIQSSIGFLGDVQNNIPIDWNLLLRFTLAAIVGVFIGLALSKKIAAGKLKKGFGWFVLTMGIYILLKELL